MTATPPPVLDDETLRMARQVFQWVRAGDLASLQPLLDQGLRPTCATSTATAC